MTAWGRREAQTPPGMQLKSLPDALRDRGLNARVVNWVGGSGVFVTKQTLSQENFQKALDVQEKNG